MGKSSARATSEHNAKLYGFADNPGIQQERILEQMHLNTFQELCMNRFKWHNLPDSVDERYLEMTLMQQAMCLFYDDNKFGYLALHATPTVGVNYYGDPVSFTVNTFGTTGPERIPYKEISYKDAVPIWANYMRRPDWLTIRVYARRLARLDHTIDINSDNQRRTRIAYIDSTNKEMSVANLNNQIDRGDKIVSVRRNANMDPNTVLGVLDLSAPAGALQELSLQRTRIYNDLMGLLGINNANQDKKERLVESEVGANDDQVAVMRAIQLNSRRQACDKINKRWPELNIGVSFYDPIEQGMDTNGDGKPNDQEFTVVDTANKTKAIEQ